MKIFSRKKSIKRKPTGVKEVARQRFKVGIPGFDDLIKGGLYKGTSVLVCGGPGSGKTIFCLQTLNYTANNGEKCLYISFEESEERLKEHMLDFGWDPYKLEKEGTLVIKRIDPYEIFISFKAMLAKVKGELLIEFKGVPGLIPPGFKPDIVVLDSLSALAAAFTGKEGSYRMYIEQVFRHFERLGVTSFLISETGQAPTRYSPTGVEEFLADTVIILYNMKIGSGRESAIEILKARGVKHQKRIVPFEIMSGKGVVVYPKHEVLVSESEILAETGERTPK